MLLKAYFALLAAYLRPQGWRVLLLALLLCAGIALQLINPQLMRYVLDTAQSGAPLTALLWVAGLFILFGIGHAGLKLAATYVGDSVGWSATNALRADLAHHVLRLDMDFHNQHTPGELIERVDGDVSELTTFFSQLTLNVVANLLLILGVLVMLYREDWRIGAAATLYALLTVGLLQAVQKRNVALWSRARGTNADLYGFIEERLAGLEDIRANGAEGYILRRLAQLQGATYRAHYAARLFGVFTFSVTHMLFVLATVLGLGIGIWLFQRGAITVGAVYLIVYYLALLSEPLEQMRDQVQELQQASASIQRVRELLALRPQVRPLLTSPNGGGTVGRSALAVAFANVTFAYRGSRNGSQENGQLPATLPPAKPDTPDEQVVLRDVNFALAPGRVLGLLGRTGSGKTTLTRLLFRLYDPAQGSIQLAGQDLRHLPLAELRRSVGMVTQEVQLFQATLRDNLTLFNPHISDKRIRAALDELGLGSWLATQPQGLETRLQAGGAGLSAGEAQLLAFVRVFLKEPGLVILDEASSRLDPATEQLLERAIDRLLHQRTGIVIAHRLATVQRADDILILREGRIAEFGERVQLLADPNSHFSQLLRTGLQAELV
jgi:ATP-binding cassette, subfamily B, bacterial